MKTSKSLFALLVAGASLLLTSPGFSNTITGKSLAEAKETTVNTEQVTPSGGEKSVTAYQSDLIDLAFEAASEMPLNPHIKNRSRAQEKIVDACLELDQAARAAAYSERIANWRKGMCFANLAYYWAENKNADKANIYIQKALGVSDSSADSEEKDWRQDRIHVRVAQTYALLGNKEEAAKYAANVVDSETGKLAETEAKIDGDDSFESQVENLDAMMDPKNTDIQTNAITAYVELFNQFYDHPEQRDKIENKIKASWNKTPVFMQIDLTLRLANFALDHNDQGKALELVNEAQALIDGSQWPPEKHVEYCSKVIKVRFRTGDIEKARSDADAELALYNKNRDKIVNIWRAGALRPLAEAYQTMGDTKTALSIYRKAIDEGMENPNSRPRTEDLCATCCSMALNAVEPDAELMTRIRKIRSELGKPW